MNRTTFSLSSGEKTAGMAIYLFAATWVGVGVQHYIYATFVAGLVPSFIGWKLFWVYLTGTAMIAAGISFIINIKAKLAAMLLAVMLTTFILLIHVPILSGHPQPINWTRALQDIALAGTALMLTGYLKLINTGRILYGACLAVLGFQHFNHVSFITAKIPPYFPLVNFWDYVVGILMILAAIYIILRKRLSVAGLFLGILIIVFAVLYNFPLLVSNMRNGQQWTGFLLDLALAAGAFLSTKDATVTHYEE